MANIRCYFDGCCEPVNPGGVAAYGAVVYIDDKRAWEASEIFIPQKGKERETSNNVAEYSGFTRILQYLLDNNLQNEPISVFGDSRLVICQMFGSWRIKKGFYKPLAIRAQEMLRRFKSISGTWIPREENSIADELSKAELHRAGVQFRIQPAG